MTRRSESIRFVRLQGGNVKSAMIMKGTAALVLLGAGLMVVGCKSNPPLTPSDAVAQIQAKYDSTPPQPISITLANAGMSQGVLDKYWVETKRYPNGYWGDFTLTPDGKKVVKLPAGGDVIQWRPDSPADKQFTVNITTIATSHLKAFDIHNIQSDGTGGMTAQYTETENLDQLPAPLQDIAHQPGNQLITQRTADFTFVNGKWTLQSIE
jgi:hypothetical protein